MKFDVELEVVWKFWREPPVSCNHFLIKIEGLYSKQVVPESEVKDVADEVGLEDVGDRGPVVVGLDEDDVVEFGRQRLLRSSDRLSSELMWDVVVGRRSFASARF